jgi:hypothetical protein
MMSFNRMILFISCALLSLGWAVTAHAKAYRLTGGGGQLQIGGGLPLPIQITNPTATGTVFPQLLIPANTGVPIIITGTVTKTMQQKLKIPVNALSKVPVQNTLGQFGQNPSLYAVATNLGFVWPATAATLSTGARTGAKTTTFTTALGNNIRYSNPLPSKFGGPARFALSAGPAAGRIPAVPVTLYGIAVPGPGNPACTHTALGGPNPACVAALAQALPTGLAAAGGPVNNAVTTPGGTSLALLSTALGAMTVPTGTKTWPTKTMQTMTNGPGPKPGIGIGKFGTNGTVSFFAFTGGVARGFTNMASSRGFPLTTGMLTISAPFALGAPEVFTITGMDNRTAGGAGTIQLVSGSLSQRTKSGPNANRGWVRLVLIPNSEVPALSTVSLAAMAGLMLLVAGYTMRRRLFA